MIKKLIIILDLHEINSKHVSSQDNYNIKTNQNHSIFELIGSKGEFHELVAKAYKGSCH